MIFESCEAVEGDVSRGEPWGSWEGLTIIESHKRFYNNPGLPLFTLRHRIEKVWYRSSRPRLKIQT